MVDHTAFLAWLVQFLFSCNLAQATFIARIAHIYVKDMFSCRALTKMLIDACLTKLQEVLSVPYKMLAAWVLMYVRKDHHKHTEGFAAAVAIHTCDDTSSKSFPYLCCGLPAERSVIYSKHSMKLRMPSSVPEFGPCILLCLSPY